MKLTAKELKLVERLRKQERRWRYTRWILLILGVVIIAMWSWVLYYVSQVTEASDEKEIALIMLLVRAMTYPRVLFGMLIAAGIIGFALRDWWGSPTRGLLLRLLEEHQVEPGTAPSSGPVGTPSNPKPEEPPSVSSTNN